MGKNHEKELPKVEHLTRRNESCLAICAGKHCAKGGAKHVIRAVRAALDEAGLAETMPVVLTRCQDYCDDGPVMTVLPEEYPYLDLRERSARQVVLDHVRDGSPVLELLPKRLRRKLARREA